MGKKSKEELAAEAQAKLDAENAEKLESEAQAKLDANGLVKVIANYDGKRNERENLWGIDFVFDGDVYVAELSKEDADAMIEAKRVKLA